MGAGAPQILAVTTNASLVMGLTFLPRDWDVSSQTSDVDGVFDGDVVVLDLGSTQAGLHAIGRLAPSSRAVVIGNEEPQEQPPQGVLVLLRPHTIDDLSTRIEHLLSPRGAEPVEWTEPSPPFDTPDEGGAAHQDGQSPIGTDPATMSAGGTGRERRSDRQERRRSLPARLFGRVVTEPADEESVAADNVIDLIGGEAQGREDHGGDASAGAAPVSSPSSLSPASPPPSPPPPPPAAISSAATAASALLERRVIQATEKGSARQDAQAPQPTRWRARRQAATPEPERQLRKRLARVLAATTELEELVEQVPLLVDLPALGLAIVREAARSLEADTVGLWQRADDGWRALAHQGLTNHGATWVVPFDQPLFSEVDATGGALLLDPVDAVQAAVAGIGGAHTESFMAAAVAAGPGRYGILAVGRDRKWTEDDLDTLAGLALEMAPGLAVAQQLERLRAIGRSRTADDIEET